MQHIKRSQINEELHLCIKKYMRMESGFYAFSLIKALRRFLDHSESNYYMGLYYLEYGRIYQWIHDWYYEGKVSWRRARYHLRNAFRYQPQNASIIFALGESYFREATLSKPGSHFRRKKLEKSLELYERAHTVDTKNEKFIWCLMEVEYLLGMYSRIEPLFNSYGWGEFAGQETTFWARILLMYSYAQQGDRKSLKAMLQTTDIPIEMKEVDVAAICIMELCAIAGDYEEMKRVYTQYQRNLTYVTSPCKAYFENNASLSFPDREIEQAVISSFSPARLVSHDIW